MKKWWREALYIGTISTLIALFALTLNEDSISIKVGDKVVKVSVLNTTPLYCFNPEKVSLESSTVAQGCTPGTQSLGAYPVPAHSAEASELNSILAIRFAAAQAVAKSEGVPLQISSGFRSRAVQDRLFAEELLKVGSDTEAIKWVLPAAISHHPQGTAIDVNYNFDRPSTKWLEINGYKFGLCRAYANEWWHFEALTSPGVKCPTMKVNASVDVEAANK